MALAANSIVIVVETPFYFPSLIRVVTYLSCFFSIIEINVVTVVVVVDIRLITMYMEQEKKQKGRIVHVRSRYHHSPIILKLSHE
jgi:hypothetical protein